MEEGLEPAVQLPDDLGRQGEAALQVVELVKATRPAQAADRAFTAGQKFGKQKTSDDAAPTRDEVGHAGSLAHRPRIRQLAAAGVREDRAERQTGDEQRAEGVVDEAAAVISERPVHLIRCDAAQAGQRDLGRMSTSAVTCQSEPSALMRSVLPG